MVTDQKTTQMVGGLGEVCPEAQQPAEDRLGWSRAAGGRCARQVGSREHGGSRQRPTPETK